MTSLGDLPPLPTQLDRLVELGVPALAGVPLDDLRAVVAAGPAGTLLTIHPRLAPASALTPLLRRAGKPGFVVVDMPDVDEFEPIADVTVPDADVYLAGGLDRGDAMAGWSPDEALPALAEAGRTPLLLSEGLQWLLQQPDVLERNHCFMTIGSRLRRSAGLDARTPAIWISNGTGRDGPAHRNAPKVGWCWAGNRHTWLGFASARSRNAPGLAGSRQEG